MFIFYYLQIELELKSEFRQSEKLVRRRGPLDSLSF